MAIDRAATLRNAEKLLRQGKLDLAVAEYLRVVDEFPRDWNTGNILGDLYVRAGQVDKAVDQFIRIAEMLSEEGFLPKAGALYKKILKIKPDHEHSLLQGAEIASSLGLLADARAYLNTVGERRRGRGDQLGLAQIRIRLGALDPADYSARFAAARARLDMNDAPGALRDYKELAAEFSDQGRHAEAIEALREAAVLSPDDEDIRARLMQVYLATGDFVRARECASTSVQFKAIAGQLEAMGQSGEALVALREAARLDPSDAALREHLARVFVERGDMTSAAEYLTVETAGSDPKLLLLVADILLRSGRIDEGMEIARRLLAEDPMRRQDVALVGWTIAEHAPEAGFRIVELAADVAVAQADWPSAAAALQEFVTRVPNHIQALMRLVEICVDGGLEATMYSAQAQLADAYITAGAASEARFIAEDLVAREPWDRANIERFRRALVLMGEPDPDGLIAERLSGQSPFMSTDLSLHGDELPPFEALPGPAPSSANVAPQEVVRAPAPARSDSLEPGPDTGHPSGAAGDSDTPATAFARPESVEAELNVVLGEARKPIAGAAPPVPGPIAADLDGVFAQMRDDASRRSTTAEDEYKRGLALFKAGQIDECIPVLQAASKAPRVRFVTAAILARIFQERGLMPLAVEWFERAAEAPPPTEDEGHRVLYELADALEATGESARALAICIELQAEAGDYRDIAARVERLAKVQSRG